MKLGEDKNVQDGDMWSYGIYEGKMPKILFFSGDLCGNLQIYNNGKMLDKCWTNPIFLPDASANCINNDDKDET